MSYDLYFRRRATSAHPTQQEFESYFSHRPSFKVGPAQAVYENDRTGIYFSFNFEKPQIDTSGTPLLPLAFNLNFFRPHTFGLEAELELTRFVKQFDLTVVDPQNSGMGEGEYSKEGFLRGWNAGNEFAYEALIQHNPTATHQSLPAAQLDAIWHWNYLVHKRQQELGDGVFVPRIVFVSVAEGPARCMVIWGDGIPILLPDVDLYLIPRKRLAAAPLPSSVKSEMTLSSRAELAPMLAGFEPASYGAMPCFRLFYEETPAEVEDFVRSAKQPAEKPSMLPVDQVLDRELLERARKTRT